MIEPKPAFRARIDELLGSESRDFLEYCYKPLRNFIRANTLKISVQELTERLSRKWEISQPYKDYEEIIEIKSRLNPGELGKSREHLLGYYYVQGLASMMPVLAIKPAEKDNVLDLCASPGIKTTQIAMKMNNSGLLMANDNALDRIIVLNSNLGRCGVTNCIITREDGSALCEKLSKLGYGFDKILVDASCSGEGIIRENTKTFMMWNEKMINNFSKNQKRLVASAISVLKNGGELVYSTCTLAPEENEGVVQFMLDNFDVKIESFELPIKTRQGILSWQGREFGSEIGKCHRVYPQDNDSEGFFVAKIMKND